GTSGVDAVAASRGNGKSAPNPTTTRGDGCRSRAGAGRRQREQWYSGSNPSRMTWALEPPKPKTLIPTRRGSDPRFGGQGREEVEITNGECARSLLRLGAV